MTDDKQANQETPTDLDETALDAVSGARPKHGSPEGGHVIKRTNGTQTEDDLYVG